MKSRYSFISVTLAFFAIVSCSKSGGDGGGGGSNCSGNTATNAGSLFTAVRTIVRNNCATNGCHTCPTPQNSINFSDDNTIVAQKNRIKVRAVDDAGTPNQMPPPPLSPLPAADRQKIVDWINAGGRITD